MRHLRRALTIIVAVVPCGLLANVGLPQSRDPAKPRIAWTTSRVTGSPDPAPPFKAVRVFPKLKFDHPLLMARCPGSDRLFVGEQKGVLYSFNNRADATADLFCDLRKEIKTVRSLPDGRDVDAVYGLAFHPQFETNRQCFVCYTIRSQKRNQRNLPDGTRVSRFKVSNTDPPRIEAASEEILLTFLQGGHNGGDLHFGHDGMLYISTGDAADPNPPDDLKTGQDISDLLSSILRIDVDRPGEPRGVSPRMNYSIPKDNPFITMKGARPEIWAYGFRNPWRMSFDRQTGDLFVGDVGWELWEMIHRVEKGGNYGWSAMEGPQPIAPERAGPTPVQPALIELPHTIACSITGGYVYRGRKFPDLQGAYIFGDWETRRLWAARFEDGRLKEMPEITRPSVRIVAFGEDHAGELYFLDYDEGTVHTIERNGQAARNDAFPTTLSSTGLFASVKQHTPAPGVMPFVINSRQWQDGATAEHWVALPGTSAVSLHAGGGKPVPGLVYWHNFRMHFPKDAVLMRTMSLAGRRIETQILHFEGADWRGYSYAWRDDQTDADLVSADGADKEIRNGSQTRLWQFPSRAQCISCHGNQSEYSLAFLPEQLNRSGPGGRNQLIALTEDGFIQRISGNGKPMSPFDTASAAREPRLADPMDVSQPLDARARAYLHANCGHCHSDHGGGAVPLRLKFPLAPSQMNAVGVRPTRGDFGLSDACIIKPGSPCSSTLFFRMAKTGRDRMPHLGAEHPDERGLQLIEAWIAGLKSDGKENLAMESTTEKQLADPTTALAAARRLAAGKIKDAEREQLLAAATKLQPGPVRDLFEEYLAEKGERKLGSSPRPRMILSLKGDAERGEKLFWTQANQCGTCHKVGDRGISLGPDLTAIGKQRSREDLLESILQPSRRIEPKFASYLARTSDGRIFTGLLTKRDESAVILRDAQNKETVLAPKDIEMLQPTRISLMPEGQLAGLTAQEAADLLEYLTSRR